MNVYITGTPELSYNKLNQVVDILNKVKGPLSFHTIEKLEKHNLLPHVDLDDDYPRIYFKNLNKVANSERD